MVKRNGALLFFNMNGSINAMAKSNVALSYLSWSPPVLKKQGPIPRGHGIFGPPLC